MAQGTRGQAEGARSDQLQDGALAGATSTNQAGQTGVKDQGQPIKESANDAEGNEAVGFHTLHTLPRLQGLRGKNRPVSHPIWGHDTGFMAHFCTIWVPYGMRFPMFCPAT